MPNLEAYWWDSARSILYFQIGGDWTWDDINALVDEGRGLAYSVAYTIAVIVDLRQMFTVPPESIYRMSGIAAGRPSNIGYTVYVTDMFMIRLLYHSFRQIYPRYAAPYHIAPTIKEAEHMIRQWQSAGKPLTQSDSPPKPDA